MAEGHDIFAWYSSRYSMLLIQEPSVTPDALLYLALHSSCHTTILCIELLLYLWPAKLEASFDHA